MTGKNLKCQNRISRRTNLKMQDLEREFYINKRNILPLRKFLIDLEYS